MRESSRSIPPHTPKPSSRPATAIGRESVSGTICRTVPSARKGSSVRHLNAQAASEDPLFFAIRPRASDRVAGVASLMSIEPEHRSIEIGHIWLGPDLQRTPAATEALFLLIAHALDDLGYRRMEWKCNAANAASRAAACRLGFIHEGVFYQHRIFKGMNRDTAWFSILDHEWPALRANFETWLDPANFDEEGKQRRSLGDLNRALTAARAGG